MKLMNRLRSNKGRRALLVGVIPLVMVLLVVTVGLVISARGEDEKVEEAETTTKATTESTSEEAEKLLDELGEDTYMEQELALDDSEENEKIEETVLPEVSGFGQKNSRYPYYIMVNRQANCVTVYEQDESGEYTIPMKAMVCSVGVSERTPLGTFRTSDKYTWRYLFGDVYGQYAYRINKNILFHSVPYYTKNKGDLESEEYNKLGEPASLGCIRLSVEDAKWLVDNCPSGTKVTIYDSPDPGPLGKPTPKKIDLNSPYKGWDPTDPDEGNPWHSFFATSSTTTTTASTRGKTTAATKASSTTRPSSTASTASSSEGIKINGPSLITINKRQSANIEEAILDQITVTENGKVVDRSRIKLDVSSLSGQSFGRFTIRCRVTDSQGTTYEKPFTVLIDLEYPVIGGENKTVTVTSESELLAIIESSIWVTDNSGEGCTLDITYTKTGTVAGGSIYRIRIIARDLAGNQGVENFTYTVYGIE